MDKHTHTHLTGGVVVQELFMAHLGYISWRKLVRWHHRTTKTHGSDVIWARIFLYIRQRRERPGFIYKKKKHTHTQVGDFDPTVLKRPECEVRSTLWADKWIKTQPVHWPSQHKHQEGKHARSLFLTHTHLLCKVHTQQKANAFEQMCKEKSPKKNKSLKQFVQSDFPPWSYIIHEAEKACVFLCRA